VNPDLRNLIALQDLDQKIARIQREISEAPAKVQTLQDELHQINDSYQKKTARNQELTKKRRVREGEVDLMRSKLSRLKEQLMAVKTNKEYTAMLHEIQMADDQIRAAEDEILDIMEEMESMEKDLKQAERDLKARTAEIQDMIRRAEASVPLLQSEVADLQAGKTDLERVVPGELLHRYRRIADQRKGVALAEARDELCTLCHVRIRPQVYADLRQGETITSCDSCSRILFLRNAT
jgi:predicted  nucleic acid-binding Zn-ribbon protein